MFTLSSLNKTVTKKKKVLGRGEGSRLGKNAGKGHKGQTKRSGKLPATFEGGRKSIVRRTPKFRGFKQGDNSTQELNISLLTKYFGKGDVISFATLLEKKLISKTVRKVRIFKKGDTVLAATIAEEPMIYLTKGAKELTSNKQ
jgi:large subunit ribosomal protein L15